MRFYAEMAVLGIERCDILENPKNLEAALGSRTCIKCRRNRQREKNSRILCGIIDKRRHENTATLTRSAQNEENAQYDWAAIDKEKRRTPAYYAGQLQESGGSGEPCRHSMPTELTEGDVSKR